MTLKPIDPHPHTSQVPLVVVGHQLSIGSEEVARLKLHIVELRSDLFWLPRH